MNREAIHDRPGIRVHLHLENAVAALHGKVRGEFLAIILELGAAYEPQALFACAGVCPFVSGRTHVVFPPLYPSLVLQ